MKATFITLLFALSFPLGLFSAEDLHADSHISVSADVEHTESVEPAEVTFAVPLRIWLKRDQRIHRRRIDRLDEERRLLDPGIETVCLHRDSLRSPPPADVRR